MEVEESLSGPDRRSGLGGGRTQGRDDSRQGGRGGPWSGYGEQSTKRRGGPVRLYDTSLTGCETFRDSLLGATLCTCATFYRSAQRSGTTSLCMWGVVRSEYLWVWEFQSHRG